MQDEKKVGRSSAILARTDGATIAYDQLPGELPGVVFLHGLNSDRAGTKALSLRSHCAEKGRAFMSFDMYGHGDSSGTIVEGSISRWTEDTLAVFEELTNGPQILVGSSMGAWVMMRTAIARPNRIHALIGVAPAPDFTEDLMWNVFSKEQKIEILKNGIIRIPSEYDEEPYEISRHLVEDGRRNLILRESIPIKCPVRLIHGQNDADVPWSTSLALADTIEGDDVQVILVKDGDHRLSRPEDIDLLLGVLDQVR